MIALRDRIQDFRERGLSFPLGIAIGLSVMVLWNLFYVYQAISTAPEVDADYLHAPRR